MDDDALKTQGADTPANQGNEAVGTVPPPKPPMRPVLPTSSD